MAILKTHEREDGSYLGVFDLHEVPFPVKRIFFVSSAQNENCSRGKHAHHECRQLLSCLSGQIEIQYENKRTKGVVILDAGQSFLHENMEWAELTFIKENSTLLSLCSHEYDEKDYIRDYDEFAEILKNDTD